jgi:hypothetical protein
MFNPWPAHRNSDSPGEGALDDPIEANDLEGRLASLDDHETPALVALDLGGELAALVTSVGDDGADGRPERRKTGHQPCPSPPIRYAGRLDPAGDQQAQRVDQDVALAALHPFVPIEAAHAPFSVVFTDCPSMMTTLGPGRRPALVRAKG